MKFRIRSHTEVHAYRTAFALVAILAVCVIAVQLGVLGSANTGEADLVLIAGFGAYGLNLITGYAGQASIGNAGFMAIGGLAGWYVGDHTKNFLLSLLAAVVAGFVIGAIVGAIALRWRGFYLVLATLAVQAVVVFVMQEIQLKNTAYLGGFSFNTASVAGFQLTDDKAWFAVLAVGLAIVILLTAGLVNGRFGRAWMAIRENESAADVCGVNVTYMKILTFAIGSGIIAFGGVLAATYAGTMSYESFTLDVSVSYVAMIIVGGLGSMAGPLLGALVVTVIPYAISNLGNSNLGQSLNNVNGGTGLPFLETMAYCIIVLLFLMFEPLGLANLGNRARSLYTRIRAREDDQPPTASPPPSESDSRTGLDVGAGRPWPASGVSNR
jgi:branched-chain amino acid transport system permease protein